MLKLKFNINNYQSLCDNYTQKFDFYKGIQQQIQKMETIVDPKSGDQTYIQNLLTRQYKNQQYQLQRIRMKVKRRSSEDITSGVVTLITFTKTDEIDEKTTQNEFVSEKSYKSEANENISNGLSLKRVEEYKSKKNLLAQQSTKSSIENHPGLQSDSQQQCFKFESKERNIAFLKQSISEKPKKQKTALQKLSLVVALLDNLCSKFSIKLLSHLAKLSTADKYIRLIYSIVKLYRGLNPENKLGQFSKQLLNARRVIQFECKYQIMKDFKQFEKLSAFDVAYKTLQLSGNLFDFSAFWMHLFEKDRPKIKQAADIVYSWQDDCYFYQCAIELILSLKGLFEKIQEYRKLTKGQDQQLYGMRHQLTIKKEQRYKLVEKLEIIKKLNGQLNGQNLNQVIFENFEQRIKLKQEQIKQAKQSYYSQRDQILKNKLMEIVKYSLKTIKYVCDSTTSLNNHSLNAINLDPVHGGILSVLSSVVSVGLIWAF